MANKFDYTAIAVKMCCPSNVVIADDKDIPGVYVKRPSMKLSELLNTTDASVHPAFRIGDATKSALYIGKFQGKADGSRLYSLPLEDPAATITLDTITQYCRNKGTGHHEITAAEWAYLALLARKKGTEPKGNNNYGKDVSETVREAIPSTSLDSSGRVQRVATGSGPMSWSDTGEVNGIWDLNGNVTEWVTGIRLVKGELQVIPNNDAALPTTDLSASSSAWRAINAAATSWDNLYIVPNGLGTTANSVKLDFVSNHWQWQKTAITSSSDTSRNGVFGNTTIAADVNAIPALYLRAMALAPDAGAAASEYGEQYFYANNAADERCARRGGSWSSGSYAGVFYLSFSYARSYSDTHVGGRPAFYE